MNVDELIAKLKGKDEAARGEAWQGAAEAGAPAAKPLARLMAEGEMEVARAAKRALWKIVRHAGRPGADAERSALVKELVDLLESERPPGMHREALWMVSELAKGGEGIGAMAAFLASPRLREDARMALERVPGEESLSALQAALVAAPDDFRPALAQSLRARGIEVPGVPCMKLVPTREAPPPPTEK
jgi:hypothetical protein